MDWKSDPELMAMRREFTASLVERRAAIVALVPRLGTGPAPVAVIEELQFICHKVAGVAGSYDFPTLTKIAEMIDDFLDRGLRPLAGPPITRFAMLLADAFAASAGGDDPASFLADPRMGELISAVGSFPSGANS